VGFSLSCLPPHLYTQTISDHFRIENFSSFCGLGLLTFPQEDSTASPTLYQGEALTTPVGESNQTSLRARCVWLCSDGRQSAETLLWRSDLACFAQQENEPDEALRLQRGLTISH
jgi:hypothetical protein